MIALLLAQIRSRWGQAMTLFLLSLAATTAAVSAPAYGVALQQAVIDNEVAAAEPAELVAGIPAFERAWSRDPGGGGASERAAARAELTGFVPVNTVQIHVREGEPDTTTLTIYRMVSRDGFCQRVVFEQGRCPVGMREAALPSSLARDMEIVAGDEAVFTPMVITPTGWVPEPRSETFAVTVVGLFEAEDPTDPYWFPMDPLGIHGQTPAVMVPLSTMWSVRHTQELLSIDAMVPPELFSPERLPLMRQQIEDVDRRLNTEGLSSGLGRGLPRLLDRIAEQTEQGLVLLPIAVVPLVALCWFVIYLAVSNGIAGRRHEVGVVLLRGVRLPTRAAVIVGEVLPPILLGAPVGLLVTAPLVALVGPDDRIVPVGADMVVAAVLATIGSLVAGLLAVRRELSAPVTDLLRRATLQRRRAARLTVEAIVVVMAVALVADLHLLDGELVGVAVVAPAAVIVAVAVVVGRVVRPLVGLAGRWTLRRGLLGPALAALYVARRPGVVPLLVTVGVGLGLLTYAAVAVDVAGSGRAAYAERAVGATRVVDVGQVDRRELLQAVRAADPTGQYAMAVVVVPGTANDPDVLAVDATRLEAVAAWQGGAGPDAAEVADSLRPPAREPVIIEDGELAVEISPGTPGSDGLAHLTFTFVPLAGGQPVEVEFGPITFAQSEYRWAVSGCADGCRLAGMTLAAPSLSGYLNRLSVVIHRVRQDGVEVGPSGWLADHDRWRANERQLAIERPQVAPVDDGLSMWQLTPSWQSTYEMYAVDVPYPLPIVATEGLGVGDLLAGLDREPIRVTRAAELDGLPGVGSSGALLDLEYAERLATSPGRAETPQVWLAPDAPADMVDRLRDQGLVVVGERSVADLHAVLERSGSALALRYHLLSAGMAILLGFGALVLVGAVDQRTWSSALGKLRGQGLAQRTTTAVALWSYGGVVLVGAIVAALAAAAAWLVTGGWMPLGVEAALLPAWPTWTQVVPLVSTGMGVLVMVAIGIAWWQRSVVRAEQR